MSEFYFGRPFSFVVTAIGQNAQNSAEWYVFDLSVDPDSLRALPVEVLASRLNQTPKPLRRLKANAAPMLASFDDVPRSARPPLFGSVPTKSNGVLWRYTTMKYSATVWFKHLNRCGSNTNPPVTSKNRFTTGSTTRETNSSLESFHATPWSGRLAIVDRFQDTRLCMIGRQLLHLERPDLLGPDLGSEHRSAIAKCLLGQCEEVQWLTLPEAIQEIELLLAAASDAEGELLCEHHQYLCDRQDHCRTQLFV